MIIPLKWCWFLQWLGSCLLGYITEHNLFKGIHFKAWAYMKIICLNYYSYLRSMTSIHYSWVDWGSVEYEVCPTLLDMISTGNRTPDFLIFLRPTPIHWATCSHKTCRDLGIATSQKTIVDKKTTTAIQILFYAVLPCRKILYMVSKVLQ